jgi:hypothetical protein
MNKHTESSRPRTAAGRCLERLVRRFGFVLIPIAEINRIEQDGIDYMRARAKHKYGTEDHGYFAGLSDYASKKSEELRTRYLPNTKAQT